MDGLKARVAAGAVAGLMAAGLCGCAILSPMTKTVTSDGNARPSGAEYKGLKHAVGCLDFENQAGWGGHWNLGHNLAIMLESALYDTGRFVLVEREKLQAVMSEQNLVASGRAAAAKSVAQTGLIRPARYIGTGAVTEVSEDKGGGFGGVSFKGISLGGGKSSAQITVIAKLVDTTTGEIIAKQRIVGQAGRVKFNVGVWYKGLGTDFGGFESTPIGEACQDCINQAAKFIADGMKELAFDGCVVKVSDGRVIINRGSDFGVGEGQEFTIREEGALLTDPDTGAILGKEEGKAIGRIRVEKSLPRMAYCSVLSGEANPKPGTLVVQQ